MNFLSIFLTRFGTKGKMHPNFTRSEQKMSSLSPGRIVDGQVAGVLVFATASCAVNTPVFVSARRKALPKSLERQGKAGVGGSRSRGGLGRKGQF